VRRLRTRLTTLAQLARLVVIQDGDNVYIEEAVPVECPVRHCLGTVGFTDDHAPTACQVMPAANLFDAAASVRGILLRRHLGELRKPFVELTLVELPGDHEFHNGFFWLLYLRVELASSAPRSGVRGSDLFGAIHVSYPDNTHSAEFWLFDKLDPQANGSEATDFGRPCHFHSKSVGGV
jgi:hypothetical protein